MPIETAEEFERAVLDDPALAEPILAAASKVPRDRITGIEDAALVALLFPVARYVVVGIGLPWLYEAARYTDLWRQKFGRYIDEQYRRNGVDPAKATAAGEELRRQLERITDTGQRASWERFKGELQRGSTQQSQSDSPAAANGDTEPED